MLTLFEAKHRLREEDAEYMQMGAVHGVGQSPVARQVTLLRFAIIAVVYRGAESLIWDAKDFDRAIALLDAWLLCRCRRHIFGSSEISYRCFMPATLMLEAPWTFTDIINAKKLRLDKFCRLVLCWQAAPDLCASTCVHSPRRAPTCMHVWVNARSAPQQVKI